MFRAVALSDQSVQTHGYADYNKGHSDEYEACLEESSLEVVQGSIILQR